MDARTDKQTDGHNAMTIARWPLANGAKNFMSKENNPQKVESRWFKTVSCTTLTISSIYAHFITLKKKALGKHCGKR